MNNFFLYLFQSGLSISVLYGIYWVFLRRDTFYKMNRYFLIIALLGSFIFPLFKIYIPAGNELANIYMLEEIVVTPTKMANIVHEKIGLAQLLFMIYLSGVVFFILRFVHQLIQLFLSVVNNGIVQQDGLKLVVMENNNSPFSFFNLVFIGKEHIDHPNIDKILEHEKIHIRQYHTFDIILLELLLIIQWFNPFIWLYKRNLKGIHEFLADEGVLRNGYKKSDYQQLLLQQTLGIKYITLSNNFNQSLIKQRFIMMSKTKTKNAALLKMVFIIPAALFFTLVFTLSFTEKVMAQAETGNNQAKEKTSDQTPQEETVFTVVEQMPEFPGGQKDMSKYLAENIKYPENARKKGIRGTVYITYIIEKNGDVSNVKVSRGVDEELDAEAMKVVSAMPTWKPGMQRGQEVRVQYTLPISFKLDEKGERKLEKTSSSGPPLPYENIKKSSDSSTNKDKPE